MSDAIMRDEPLFDGISFIELVDTMGTDLTVVNAARVSYAKRSTKLDEKDKRLIKRMMRLQHGSPFEHVVFQFRVRAPLHVVHQWERHRMSSYNEESGRWVEMRGDFFNPGGDNAAIYEQAYGLAYATYQWLLEHGESKENARLVLPIALYKEFIWTVNGRALLNFVGLRNSEEAQEHICAYADSVETMAAFTIPSVLEAFNEYGRRQP